MLSCVESHLAPGTGMGQSQTKLLRPLGHLSSSFDIRLYWASHSLEPILPGRWAPPTHTRNSTSLNARVTSQTNGKVISMWSKCAWVCDSLSNKDSMSQGRSEVNSHYYYTWAQPGPNGLHSGPVQPCT